MCKHRFQWGTRAVGPRAEHLTSASPDTCPWLGSDFLCANRNGGQSVCELRPLHTLAPQLYGAQLHYDRIALLVPGGLWHSLTHAPARCRRSRCCRALSARPWSCPCPTQVSTGSNDKEGRVCRWLCATYSIDYGSDIDGLHAGQCCATEHSVALPRTPFQGSKHPRLALAPLDHKRTTVVTTLLIFRVPAQTGHPKNQRNQR